MSTVTTSDDRPLIRSRDRQSILQTTGSEFMQALDEARNQHLAPEKSKHRFNVKTSTLLKLSGSQRALGAYQALILFANWDVVKSYGPTWAPILLHALDLPDHASWVPAIKALSKLYSMVHGKQDLIRELGSSKPGEFVRRLVSLVPHVPSTALPALHLLIRLYPAQSRPFEVAIKDCCTMQLFGAFSSDAAMVMADLPSLDKTPEIAWKRSVTAIIQDLNSVADGGVLGFFDAAEPEVSSPSYSLLIKTMWSTLAAFIAAPPSKSRVKIPAQDLITTISAYLDKLKPAMVEPVLLFITQTFDTLFTLYVLNVDTLLKQLTEAMWVSRRAQVISLQVATVLINGAGWLAAPYIPYISKMCKSAAGLQTSEVGRPDGLADFVSDPSTFSPHVGVDAQTDASVIADFYLAVTRRVSELPNSIRSTIDAFALNWGGDLQYYSSLYPSTYSILPMALAKGLDGFETLIHPRFPPTVRQLAEGQVINGDGDQLQDFDEPADPVVVEEEEMMKSPQSAEVNADADVGAEAETVHVQLPVIEKFVPLPPKLPASVTVVQPHADEPPEKRLKIEQSDQQENEEEESDDGFVMPELTMDSD